ncbi:MAG: SGNH/GDSL hydrolase family protein [Verrucomicrobiota bacterium]|nr:SGNH/GDSL hydrolase family protein [Verrucomicrobiota bacterium]
MPQQTPFLSGQTLLFVGDSITDASRREPQNRPLGWGYVRIFHDMQKTREPAKKLNFINSGCGGNNVEDLRSRWQDDVLDYKPDWLFIKIGINDLNQFLAHGRESVNPAGFKVTYDELLRLTRRVLPECKIVLLSPFHMSYEANAIAYRAKVNVLILEYLAVVRELAMNHQAGFIDLHSAFLKLRQYLPLNELGDEPVHPNSTGHFFIADQIWNSLTRD